MSTEAETPAPETNENPAGEEGTWPKSDDNLKVEDIEHTDTPAPEKKSKHHKSHKHKGDKNIVVDADSEIKVSESADEGGNKSKKFSVNKSFELKDETAKPKDDAVEPEKKESLETTSSVKPDEGGSDDKKEKDKKVEIDPKDATAPTKVYKFTATFILKEKNQSKDPGKPGKIITKITTKTYKCSSDSPIEKESVLVKLKAGEKIEGIVVDLKEETEVKETDDDGSIEKKLQEKEKSSEKMDQKVDLSDKATDQNDLEKQSTLNLADTKTKDKSEALNETGDESTTKTVKKTKKSPKKTSKESSIDKSDVDLDKTNDGHKSQDDGKSDGTKESSIEIDHVEMREKLENLDKEIDKLLKKTEVNASEPEKTERQNKEEALKTEKKDLESTLQTLNDETEYRPRRRRNNADPNFDQSSPKIEKDTKVEDNEPKKEKSPKSDEVDPVSKRSPRNKSPDSHDLGNAEDTDYVPRRRRLETSPDQKDKKGDTSSRRRKLSPEKTEDSSTSRRLSDTSHDDENKSKIKEGSPNLEDSNNRENGIDDEEGDSKHVPRSRRDITSPTKIDDSDISSRRRRAKISPEKEEASEYVPRSRRKETSPDKTEENTTSRRRRELSPKSTDDTDYIPRRRRKEQSPIVESRRRASPVKDNDDYIPKNRRKNSDTKTSYDTNYEPSSRKTYAAPSYTNYSTNKNSTFNPYKPSSNAYSAYSSYKPESPLTKAKNDYFSMDSYYPGKYSSAPRGERTLGVDPLSIKTYIYEATTGDPSPKKEPSEFEARYAKYLRESTPITDLKPKPLYDLDTTKTAHSPSRHTHYDFDPIYRSGPLLRQPSPSYLESRRSRQPSTDVLTRSKSPAPKYDYNYEYDKPYTPLTRTLPTETYGEKPSTYDFKYYKPSSPLDIDDYKSNLRSIYRLDPEGSAKDEQNYDGKYRRYHKNNDDTEAKPSYSKYYGADTPSKFSSSNYLPHRSIYSDVDRYKPSTNTVYNEREDPDSKALSDYNNKYRRVQIESPPNINITLVREPSEEPRGRRSTNPPEELLSTSVMPLSEYMMRQTPRIRDDPLDYLDINDRSRRRERAPMSYQASLNYGRPSVQPDYDTYSCLRRNITPVGEPTRYVPQAPSPCYQHSVPMSTSQLRHPHMPIFSQEAALVKRAHQLISKIVADTTAGQSTRNTAESYQIPRRF